MTADDWDDYSARVIAYVRRHGHAALLRAWLAKTRAEDTPNPTVLEARARLCPDTDAALRAMYEDAA